MTEIERMVNEKLGTIENYHNVKILFAAETGSRATGFEAPDSDYDIRFVYMHEKKDYLRINDMPDVIESRADDMLDISGMDIRKALMLIGKGNPNIAEWSNSPIIYRKTDKWDIVEQTANAYFSERGYLVHYYGKAQNAYKSCKNEKYVTYNKYFYALHALLCCRWISRYHEAPPVRFEDILQLFNIPDEGLTKNLYLAIQDILAQKAKKKALKPQIPVILEFIQKDVNRQRETAYNVPLKGTDYEDLNEIFRTLIS